MDPKLQALLDAFTVRDFYVYELDFAALAVGVPQTNSFTVQADSNFLWQQGCQFTDLAGAVQTASTQVQPLVTVTILDTSSGRQLTSAPSPVPSLFGDGNLPYNLPTPRFFRSNTQVSVTATSYAVAGTTYTNMKLQFIGTKFFN